MINSQQMRAIFKGLYDESKAKGLPAPQVGFLRSEILADPNKSIYKFSIKESGGSTALPTEQRLQDNDAMFAKYARLRLKQEDPTKPGQGRYITNVDTGHVTAVALQVDLVDLASLWNSKLQLLIDQKEVLKGVDMRDSMVLRNDAATPRGVNHTYDGFVDLHSLVRLGGSASIEVNLILPAFQRLIQHTTAATRIYLSLDFYGFIVPSGSALGQVSINY